MRPSKPWDTGNLSFSTSFEEAIVLAIFGFIPGLIVSIGLYAA
jgi:hypothetical protein